MAFNFLQDFKLQIFEILTHNANISSKVDRVYLSIVQDAKYPFLLININEIKNHSLNFHGLYNIEFEICLFIRDKSLALSTLLLNDITNVLSNIQFGLSNYTVAGLKSDGIRFEPAADLLTTKLCINYNALIKEVHRDIP